MAGLTDSETAAIITEDGDIYVLTDAFSERPDRFESAGNCLVLGFPNTAQQALSVGPRTAQRLSAATTIYVSETGGDGPVHITPVARKAGAWP